MNGLALLGILAFVYAGLVFFIAIFQIRSGIWLRLMDLKKYSEKKVQ